MNIIHQFLSVKMKIKNLSVVAIRHLLDQEQEQDTRNEWDGWTCDELTPNLCDLTVTMDQIPIEDDIFVQYWKYSVSPSESPVDDTNNNTNNSSNSSYSSSFNCSAAVQTATATPIIIIHGGPGMAHNYMLTLKQLA